VVQIFVEPKLTARKLRGRGGRRKTGKEAHER